MELEEMNPEQRIEMFNKLMSYYLYTENLSDQEYIYKNLENVKEFIVELERLSD